MSHDVKSILDKLQQLDAIFPTKRDNPSFKKIKTFESMYEISLPEEYKSFLTHCSNVNYFTLRSGVIIGVVAKK